ncbi:MAG: hypothetical protein KDE56_32410, partial [Anaerolineales bacterium]|nr:hypothetical protein [Anaerolineales bacterium]
MTRIERIFALIRMIRLIRVPFSEHFQDESNPVNLANPVKFPNSDKIYVNKNRIQEAAYEFSR